jgi:hypothetical protein
VVASVVTRPENSFAIEDFQYSGEEQTAIPSFCSEVINRLKK